MTSVIGSRYDQLIRHERVHGSLYTDPDIFAEELPGALATARGN